MYSVEDLLISHGYKIPRNSTPASRGPGGESQRGASGDGDCKGRMQRREESSRGDCNHGNSLSPGEFSMAESRSFNGSQRAYCPPRTEKDINYWKRRGQDFSVLLDYADFREGQWNENAWLWEARLKATNPGDRKCQSLGTEEWKPAVSLGRQFSDGEGERFWAQERRRPMVAEGAVPSQSERKAQSLPKFVSPESLLYAGKPLNSTELYGGKRLSNSAVLQGPYNTHHQASTGRLLWSENRQTPGQDPLLPKPKFARPLKPPSYEVHQQTRGSWEMLVGESGPRTKNRLARFPKPDYFAVDLAGYSLVPPGYIPPPSYKRPLLHNASQRNYREYYKGEESGLGSWDSRQWLSEPNGGFWVDKHIPCQRLLQSSGNVTMPVGCVPYLPSSDPRRQRVSEGQVEISVTDSEKSRNICRGNPSDAMLGQSTNEREVPNACTLGQSIDDSAFCPSEGHTSNADSRKVSLIEHNGSSRREEVMQGSEDAVTHNKNCNVYHTPFPYVSPQLNGNGGQGFSPNPTTTQVKKIEPGPEAAATKHTKRKVNETIFCLVSVPLYSQPDEINNNTSEKSASMVDQNKNQSPSQNQSIISKCTTTVELKQTINVETDGKPARRSCLKKDSVNSKPILCVKRKEMGYSGSWPGDQYKDQETQTSSPEVLKFSQNTSSQQAQGQGHSSPDSAVSSSRDIDGSNLYGFQHMKGQKNLNPSSNSAFSKTNIVGNQLQKNATQPGQFSGNMGESQKKMSPVSIGSSAEVFGQFLLKPVSRRPCDAIEELESFNKELQDQSSQQACVDKCIEDLDEAYKDILELSTTSNNGSGTMKTPLSSKENLRSQTPNEIKPTVKQGCSGINPQHIEGKSAFSRSVAKTVSFNLQPHEQEPGWSKDSTEDDCGTLNKRPDLNLVTISDAPRPLRHQMQDASTRTSPPDYEDVCHNLHLIRDNARGTPTQSKTQTLSIGPPRDSFKSTGSSLAFRQSTESRRRNSVPRFSGERTFNVLIKNLKHSSHSHGPRWIVSDKLPAANDSLVRAGWKRQLSLAERHLESLLLNEKANSLPVEDLSSLYEVKCAKSIPENESLEQRAARILGIEVPVESLGVREQNMVKRKETNTEGVLEKDLSEPVGSCAPCLMALDNELEKEPVADVEGGKKTEAQEGISEGGFAENQMECNPSDEANTTTIIQSCDELTQPNNDAEIGMLTSCPTNAVAERLHVLPSEMKQLDTEGEMEPESKVHLDKRSPPCGTRRKGTVIKREITLPLGLCAPTVGASVRDVDVIALSDLYDPSHVERV